MKYKKLAARRRMSGGFFREFLKDLLADRRSKKFRKSKLILGFFYGFFLSLILYHFVIVDLEFTEQTTHLMGIIIGLFLSIGHAISQQVRCLGLLAMPTFCDKSGQRVLVTMVFAYVMAGPLNNIMRNGSEVIRVFTCSSALVYNLTKTRYELMFKPFQEALFNLKAETNEIKETINSINDVIDPIRQEFESDSDSIVLHERNDYLDDLQMRPSKIYNAKSSEHTKNMYKIPEPSEVEIKYRNKLHRKCKGIIDRADEKCKAAFQNSYDNCRNSVHWSVNWALCWPMQVTFVCNLAPSGSISRRLRHDSRHDDRFPGEKAGCRVRVRVRRRLLAFSFLKILLDSQSYMHKYLTDIEHDNAYVTRYYRKIDARRKKTGKHTLLPLKKTEKSKMVDLRSYKLVDRECDHLFKSLVKLVFEIIAASSLVLLDIVFYEALDVIKRHAKIDYFQTGHHNLYIKVKGTGMIANLLRSVVDRFNFRKNITVNLSNEMCLPNPYKLDAYYLHKIYGTLMLVFVMTVFAGYSSRLKRLICAVFFRKREKRRVLYLYNETLRKRTAFFRYMKQKVAKLARENKLSEDLDIFLMLRLKFPALFGWLVWFSCGRRKCLICGEPETNNGKQYGCNTVGCVYIHCEQCWKDVGVCYACSEIFIKKDNEYNLDADTTAEGYVDTDYYE
ncbi:LOW QUALITY PROTEIN: protein sneaky [Rhopalosiphum maidis]|uniref:LOW QUALITY PROTEIN: protein sneaky n=1 Tax=Rhopalosiphum maidis TaxID=43146 RepID=UPI000F00F728|nr:LOW QUALITY PROTEIN: protein sneaky [Rhopalosiphum maidis]